MEAFVAAHGRVRCVPRTSNQASCRPRRRLVVAVASPTSPGAAAAPAAVKAKLGVLLLNLGGPERQEDVQPFLYNLFADPDIIRLPAPLAWLQNFLAGEIARSRAPKSRAAYESIGGGSPIVRITNQQAEALQQALADRDTDASVYVGMRYWHTFTEEAMQAIRDDGVSKLVVLPLYPHFSITTTGSSLRVLDRIVREDPATWSPLRVDHTVVADWYSRPGYVESIAGGVRRELSKLSAEDLASTVIMFSAHGVPETYVEKAGDPYKRQIEECVQLVMDRVGGDTEWTLCFQSRVGPVTWLQPYTDEVIVELGKRGVKNLVVVPISFVSEHIETLEELDIEYRELAEESGVERFLRVPALNTEEAFIDDLAELTLEACSAPSLRVGEALALKYPAGRDAELPPVKWGFGFNPAAEAVNGRLAMVSLMVLAFAQLLSTEVGLEMLRFLR